MSCLSKAPVTQQKASSKVLPKIHIQLNADPVIVLDALLCHHIISHKARPMPDK